MNQNKLNLIHKSSDIILAIDTSTSALSLALNINGEICSIQKIIPRQHHEYCLPEIKHLLEQNNLSIKNLTGIAVGIGPGSFVGTRLACAVAQGLAAPFDIPVYTFSSLQLWAYSIFKNQKINSQNQTIQTTQIILDAKMGELYFGEYQNNPFKIITVDSAILINQLDALLNPNSIIYTDYQPLLNNNKNNLYQNLNSIYPDVKFIFECPEIFLNQPEKIENINPIYLRQNSQWVKKSND